MPTSTTGQAGPVTPWITASGWASAAQGRYGHAWIVTPEGVFSAAEARDRASRPALAPHAPRTWRRRVPEPAITAAKDARRFLEARRFASAASQGPWTQARLAFVWQRHDFFHTAGFRLARAVGCPVVLSVHAPLTREARTWGVRRPGWTRLLERVAERPQWSAADLVTCVSDEVAGSVHAAGVPERRLLITPNGVDLELFRPDMETADLRARLGLTGKFVVGWAGSFRRFHGLDHALRAVALLQERMPEAAMLLVGDGLERRRLEEMGRQLGLRHLVITGTVPYTEMPRYLALMDAALVVAGGQADFHYSPVKLREYMACARPVVAPRLGEIPRFVRDGEQALLVPAGQVEALVAALERLHDDPALGGRLGAAALEKIRADGSWDVQVQNVERALARLEKRPLDDLR